MRNGGSVVEKGKKTTRKIPKNEIDKNGDSFFKTDFSNIFQESWVLKTDFRLVAFERYRI